MLTPLAKIAAILLFLAVMLGLGQISHISAEQPPISQADSEFERFETYNIINLVDARMQIVANSTAIKFVSEGRGTGVQLVLAMEKGDDAAKYIGLEEQEKEIINQKFDTIAGQLDYEGHYSPSLEARNKFFDGFVKKFPFMLEMAEEYTIETLSPEQLRRLQEYLYFNPPEDVLPGFVDFDALQAIIDPSEIQRELIAEMKRDHLGELNEKLTELAGIYSQIAEEEQKEEGNIDHEKIKELLAEIEDGLVDEETYEEIRKRYIERIGEILTEKQKAKLEELEKKQPKRAEKTEDEPEITETEKYQPNKDSWQPGDPIPESPKPERQSSAFPLK